MAIGRVPFVAHKADVLSRFQQGGDERFQFRHDLRPLVEILFERCEAVPMRLRRAPECFRIAGKSCVDVLDLVGGQCVPEGFLRKAAFVAPRRLANVNDDVNIGINQPLEELIERSELISDRQEMPMKGRLVGWRDVRHNSARAYVRGTRRRSPTENVSLYFALASRVHVLVERAGPIPPEERFVRGMVEDRPEC